MKALLTTSDLEIGYEDVIASGINTSLCRGQLVSLIGANGVGKSTFLRTLAGLQKKLSGAITIDGKPASSFSAVELARKLSVVLTDKLPPSNLSVFELVATGRQPYTNWIGTLAAADLSAINRSMELTGTSILKNSKTHQLSDGQLQKVMIARALAQEAPIIILDEPSTHLDLVHKAQLFRLLKTLAHQENKTVLFSTHDIELALETSDQVIMMTPGRVVQEATAEALKNNRLQMLFDDPDISFDPEKVKFVFKNL